MLPGSCQSNSQIGRAWVELEATRLLNIGEPVRRSATGEAHPRVACAVKRPDLSGCAERPHRGLYQRQRGAQTNSRAPVKTPVGGMKRFQHLTRPAAFNASRYGPEGISPGT